MNKLDIYGIGTGGVNLTKNPLQLADNELTQAQNAEWDSDESVSGAGAISKRGGFAALTSALAGSVSGIHPFPHLTTYTRTLYVSRGTEDSNTFMTSSDGTTFTDTSTPRRVADNDKYLDENSERDNRRMVSFRNLLFFAGNDYAQDTDNPEISVFDGTTGALVTRINIGPSGNGSPPYAITDMLVANGKVYIAVHDPGGSGANLAGRVLAYDPVTGKLIQVLNAFGPGSADVSGGYPSSMVWYQNQLWVGLNGSATTDGIGKVVRGYPDVGTTWTTETSTLRSHISTMCVFNGDLYVGTQSSVSAGATIAKRTASSGAWSTVATSSGGAGGSGHYAHMIVYSSAVYCVEYFSGGTDILHILRSTDGTTWSTDRDVDANDSPTDPPQLPAGSVQYGDDLFFVFRATTIAGTNGFIMRRRGGSWSKVATDNFSGPLAVLVTRT